MEGFDFINSKIINCLFNESTLTGNINFFNVEIDGCNFDACTFKSINFSSSILKNNLFSKWKKSSKCSFDAKLIQECKFSGDFKGIYFWDSPIKDSVFEGNFVDCSFYGIYDLQFEDSARTIVKKIDSKDVVNRMEDADFSDAFLSSCSFKNFCYLDLVKPPKIERSCIVRLTNDFYENLKINIVKTISTEISRKALSEIDTFYKPDIRAPYGALGFEDLVKYFGKSENDVFYKTFCDTAIQTNAIVK